MSKRIKLLVMCVLVGIPQFAHAQYRGGYIISDDEEFGLRLNGRVQARYEYLSPAGDEDLSSFYLRRLRLDFRGHIFDKRLTFRAMPDFARIANLRDGWLDYSFGRSAAVRAGQMVVPFQRQRAVSGIRQHFTERSVTSETFGAPGGYDIGVMLHGWLPSDIQYSVGIYDGSGRNTKDSNSNGNLLSARLMRALMGRIAADESDLAVSKTPNVTLGLGFKGATKNEVRDWALGRATNNRADFISGTADIHLAWRGFSTAFDYYVRNVSPDATESYTGGGFLATAGYLFGGRYEVVGRYSSFHLDRNDNSTENNQIGLGMNIYHRAHNHKTRINYFRDEIAGNIDNTFLVEAHISF